MKRTDLIKILEKNGFSLSRHGSEHDVYSNEIVKVSIPRHREINELTARGILKEVGLK